MTTRTEAPARSRIDVHARRWGGPDGGPDGMAVAASFLAFTLAEIGYEVRAVSPVAPPFAHTRIGWVKQSDFSADLIVTTLQPSWSRFAAAAVAAGAAERTVYWHHHDALPPAYGCQVAAPPASAAPIVLPPSSWAAEEGGPTGDAILVPGAGALKGGYIAAQVAARCPDLPWLLLPCRHAPHDLPRWRELPNATIAPGPLPPRQFLAQTRAVLSPTRAEVHPLALVEAAVRGISVVCTDLPGCRAALGDSALYVPEDAPAEAWEVALRTALLGLPRLRLRPYGEVVSDALAPLLGTRRAA